MTNNVSTILEGLNDEQRRAVQCTEGPVLIVAGAGSGKTRVLTSRIAYILAGGCDPHRIMALTFTKKAATGMKERIALMVAEGSARHLVMGTFHAVFVRFLREYSSSLGYPEQFTIYDQADSVSAVRACIRELGLDDKVYKPREVLSRISMAKNDLVTVRMYRSDPSLLMQDSRCKRPRLCDIYERYVARCRQSGVMDFDDILLNMNILLRDNAAARAEISDRFSYILVDEYQDTNRSQYQILKRLVALHHNICVVGDDSQSIYAFRGARIENILNFKTDYPRCRVFRLERNYRSTRTIVDAANSLIAHNDGRIPKKCYAEGDVGERIRLIRSYSEKEEAISIVSEIAERLRADRAQYQDFAVLYRTNSQSRALEEALRNHNIPYRIFSGNSFFERAEVKDMMAYFKLAVNPHDDESFKRAVNKPARGIGETTVHQLEEAARTRGCSLFKAAAGFPKLAAFCAMVNSFAMDQRSTDAHELALRIADRSGLYAFYKSDTSVEGLSRMANIEELLNSIELFVEERIEESEDVQMVTLAEYLENSSLLSNVDVHEDEDSLNKVALMTVHSSKGLEFQYVFIAGLEENLFPTCGFSATRDEIEEERRLFYVALTRAKKYVGLSFAEQRMRNGKHESNPVSRFVREIDRKYISNAFLIDESGFGGDEDGDGPGFISRFSTRASGTSCRYGQSSPARPASGCRYGKSSPSGARQTVPGSQRYGSGPGRQGDFRGGSGYGQRSAPTSGLRSCGASVPSAAGPDSIDPNFVPDPMGSFRVGDRIEHNRFGAGTVTELTGREPEIKARVDFDALGEKILLLKYARMRHIER